MSLISAGSISLDSTFKEIYRKLHQNAISAFLCHWPIFSPCSVHPSLDAGKVREDFTYHSIGGFRNYFRTKATSRTYIVEKLFFTLYRRTFSMISDLCIGNMLYSHEWSWFKTSFREQNVLLHTWKTLHIWPKLLENLQQCISLQRVVS